MFFLRFEYALLRLLWLLLSYSLVNLTFGGPMLIYYTTAATHTEDWRPLPADSVCRGAFGMDNWAERTNRKLQPFFNFSAETMDRIKLINVNVGFGTTGTRTRFQVVMKKYHGCHYSVCYNDAKQFSRLAAQNAVLIDCYLHKSKTHDCLSTVFMANLKENTGKVSVSGQQAIADTPVGFLFRDLLDLVPGLEVEHTVRDPRDWVLDRVEKHTYHADYLCDPRLTVNTYTVSTPFHLYDCIPHSQYVFENIIVMQDYLGITPAQARDYRVGNVKPPPEVEDRIQNLMRYYVEYTQMTMNLALSRPSIKSYTPICVFDDLQDRS